MADNVTAGTQSGSGPIFASDEITSAHYPRVKLIHGADGTNDGDVSTANPYPVRLYLGTTAVSVGAGVVGTGVLRITAASDDPIVTSVQLLDDAIVADDAAFTPATTKVMMAGFEFDDTTPDSVNEGDAGAARMSANRCIYVNLRDNAGNERGLNIDASGNLTANITGSVTVGSHAVTNAGTFVVQVDGAALTALQLIDNLVLAEDAAHSSGEPGLMALAVRRDSPIVGSGTDGDYSTLNVDGNGRLYVACDTHAVTQSGTWNVGTVTTVTAVTTVSTVTNVATIGTSVTPGTSAAHLGKAEDAVHTTGDTGVFILAVRSDTAASTSGTDGDYTGLITDSTGKLHVNVGNTVTVASHAVTNAGTFAVQAVCTNAGTFAVQATCTNAGTFVTQVDGAALTALQLIDNLVLAEDAAHISADPGVQMLAVRRDSPVVGSGTDGDYSTLNVDGNGRLYVGCDTHAVTQSGTWNVGTVTTVTTVSTVTAVTTVSTLTTLTGGAVAHDGVDSGNPIKVGARAAATLSDDTMVANADRTDAVSDLDAALITRPQFPLGDLISERVSNTDGAATAFTNFGATASTRSVITAIVAWNSSATAGYIDFRDGVAGAILFTVPIPATGGVVLPAGATPYFRTTANTALAFDVSGALTTVYISVSGFKSKV